MSDDVEGKNEMLDGHDVAKVNHVDGTVDYIDAKAVGGELEQMPRGYYYSADFLGTVIAACLGNNCAYLGWVLPSNTLTLINEDLGKSPNINWVATVWTLGSCIGFLLIGRLSDIFGRKWMVMATQTLGLVGCIIGSCAQSVNMLIAANLFNGLAASGQLSFGITMGELVANKHRGVMAAIIFLSCLPFAVFGPVIARAFIDHTASRWRWSFFIGDILSALSLVLYYRFYHPPSYAQLHMAGKSRRQQMRELDYVGMALFVGGCVLFLIGLSWGGIAYAWTSGHTLGTLLAGAALLAAFVVWEVALCQRCLGARGVQPLMPARLFANRGFVGIVLCAALAGMIYYSFTVLWPTLISSVYYPTSSIDRASSMAVGWQSSVIGGGTLLGQTMSGCALGYVPRVRWQVVAAAVCVLAFITPLATCEPTGASHHAVLGLGLLGLVGIGFIENVALPGTTLVLASHQEDIGLATGVMSSMRSLGGAVAQAMYVNVLQNKLATNIPRYVAPAALAAGLPSANVPPLLAALAAGTPATVSALTAAGVPLSSSGTSAAAATAIADAASYALRVAYAHSFHIVFFCTVPFSVILVASAWLVPNMDPFLHLNVAKRLQGRQHRSGKPAPSAASASAAVSDVEKASDAQVEHPVSRTPVPPSTNTTPATAPSQN